MTPSDDHIRSLLGRALGEEPPLRLDRDEILRRGRRGVRIRRLAASGGVAATVVAVVLAAAALSNLPGGGSDVAPADGLSTGPSYTTTPAPSSTSLESAPLGPQLPLTTTTSATRGKRAVELTQVLAEAKVIPTEFELRSATGTTSPLAFAVDGEGYLAAANLADARGVGSLDITVVSLRGGVLLVGCPPNDAARACTVETVSGLRMALITEWSGQGGTEYRVQVARPDGTKIDVRTTNTAFTNRNVVTRAKPPVEFDVLKRIAVLPRLTFG